MLTLVFQCSILPLTEFHCFTTALKHRPGTSHRELEGNQRSPISITDFPSLQSTHPTQWFRNRPYCPTPFKLCHQNLHGHADELMKSMTIASGCLPSGLNKCHLEIKAQRWDGDVCLDMAEDWFSVSIHILGTEIESSDTEGVYETFQVLVSHIADVLYCQVMSHQVHLSWLLASL